MKKILPTLILLAFCTFFMNAQFKNFITMKGDNVMDGATERRFFDERNVHFLMTEKAHEIAGSRYD